MGVDFLVWMWLGIGVTLIVAEFALPGLVSVFGGLAALVVAALSFAGLTSSLTAQMVTWMVLSVGMVVTLRKAARSHFQGDVRKADIDEARMHYGNLVEVLEEVSDEEIGRIRYQGSTWSAISTGARLSAGDKAKLVFKDNLTWIIEPLLIDDDMGSPSDDKVVAALTEGNADDLKVPQQTQETKK